MSASAAGAAPILEMYGVSKHFDRTRVLADIDLVVPSGRIHGLLGENGSGKSTIIKILAGYHAPDRGSTIRIDGKSLETPILPAALDEHGVRFVHQDLGLIGSLTVLENLLIGELAVRGRAINWRFERRRATSLLRSYGLEIDVRAPISSLSSSDRAMLAIVRAFEGTRGTPTCRLLVLDEPTVFLPKDSTDQLFQLTRDLVARGSSVLFVSHDLDEVMEITDDVTVLRDGAVKATLPTATAQRDDIVELIIGRRLERTESRPRTIADDVPPAARWKDVRTDRVPGVSLCVWPGEILGLTGVVGSGFEELPYVMFGSWNNTRGGELLMNERRFELRRFDPRDAIRHGLALIPSDRASLGSIPSLSVRENISMQVLGEHSAWWRVRSRELNADVVSLMDKFDIRPRDPKRRYGSLSGGNQQKVLLAKWIRARPEVLLLHEPTQGVDIGARHEIFRTLRQLSENGTAIVCASSDHEQLEALCDRVLVLSRGRIVDELARPHISKQAISHASYVMAPQ